MNSTPILMAREQSRPERGSWGKTVKNRLATPVIRSEESVARIVLVLAFLLCVFIGPALDANAQTQELQLDLEQMIAAAEQWAKENLDEDVLNALAGVDGEKVRRLLAELQRELHGEYVLDLGALAEAARAALPVLEGYEETLPYALWLRSRLDYLEVARDLQTRVPPPRVEPEMPRRGAANPGPVLQREIWIEKLASRPWPKNAKSYISSLKPVFAARKVPPELVWIAEVESSFDPRARSPEGAAGLFQLMPATARRYGLRTWPLDQRLKPEPSAAAAAQYLRFLHGKFKDWRLALAAYNAGEGRVQTLLQRHKTTSYDQIATRLPAETQMYVPKVESVLLRREGLKLSQLKVPALERGSTQK